MKKFSVLALLAVCACTPYGPSYKPPLAGAPVDEAKYEADRQACFKETKRRIDAATEENRTGATVAGGFGLIGALVHAATVDSGSDYHKKPSTIFNECIQNKGYALKPDKECYGPNQDGSVFEDC